MLVPGNSNQSLRYTILILSPLLQADKEMQEPEEKQPEKSIDRHPLITLGVLTAGTQIGAALILRMGKHPLILFGMGVTAGIYTYKNRKEILQEAHHLTNQGKKLISRKSASE